MAALKCPHCGAAVTVGEGWARAATSILSQAPAVPGMANQVRCAECRQIFTEPAGSQRFGCAGLWPTVTLVLVLLAVGFA